MKNTRKNIGLIMLLGSLLLSVACKTAKRSGDTTQLKEKTTRQLLKQLNDNKIETEWLSSKARVSYDDEYEKRKFNINFRYRRDSIIWLNVKKATVEAFRIQVTPDSFFLIDRLNKEYYINSITKLEDRFNLPKRTAEDPSLFVVLENILLGNPLFFSGSALESGIDGQEYTLKGKTENFESEYRIEATEFLLSAMNFDANNDKQYLKVDMDRSEFLEDYPKFSYIREYTFNDPERGEIEMKLRFSDLELNEPSTIRFSIPSNYKRIE
jgi:hypothetical protein